MKLKVSFPMNYRHPWCFIRFANLLILFVSAQAEKMRPEERNCSLTLDETELSPSVEYDAANGCILGDSTFPDSSQKTCKALTFMLSGKQVINTLISY